MLATSLSTFSTSFIRRAICTACHRLQGSDFHIILKSRVDHIDKEGRRSHSHSYSESKHEFWHIGWKLSRRTGENCKSSRNSQCPPPPPPTVETYCLPLRITWILNMICIITVRMYCGCADTTLRPFHHARSLRQSPRLLVLATQPPDILIIYLSNCILKVMCKV
jgi:hypothetical protein